ncbi:MAG: translation initiation factor IF-2 subunit alpha [Candidatus Thermoplasmatota archaeon]|nr:translation initiation factor IF-2 subunit alpha [Candidatus Thermoplasmatota archaeon]
MVPANDMPEEGELVVATVKQVKNFGAVVELDEFPGKEGFIHIAEVASGWVKYIRDHVREGQKVVCKVLGIDERRKNRTVDLSLKAVNEHQKREKIQQWKSEQKAQKLLQLLCENMGIALEKGMEDFGYDLISEYGSLYHAFEMSSMKEVSLEESGFQGEWVQPFIRMAQENITPPYVEIHGILELTSTNPDGLIDIKSALEKAESMAKGIDDVKLDIIYIGSPKYRLVLIAPNYKVAEEILRSAAQTAVDHLNSRNGVGKFVRNKD